MTDRTVPPVRLVRQQLAAERGKLQAQLTAERALADRLAEALRLAMPYVRPHAPLGSAPQIEGETALAEHAAAREGEA